MMSDDLAIQSLLARNLTLQENLREARRQVQAEQTDPATGLPRAHVLIGNLDALLRLRLKTAGAVKLLRGATVHALSDEEYDALALSIVCFVLTYPNGLFRSDPMRATALRTLGRALQPHLFSLGAHDTVSGLNAGEDAEIDIQKAQAGALDGSVCLLFAGPAHMTAGVAKLIAEDVRHLTTSTRLLADAGIPFRVDHGGALLAEALTAAAVAGRTMGTGNITRLEFVRRLLLEVASERASHSRLLATLSLQVRLLDRHEPSFFNRVMFSLGEGALVLKEAEIDALIASARGDGPLVHGRPPINKQKLIEGVRAFGEEHISARLDRLNRRIQLYDHSPASAAHFEYLVLLAAHNRLREFGDR